MENSKLKARKKEAKKPQKPPDPVVEVSATDSGGVVWLKIDCPVQFEGGSTGVCMPWRHACRVADAIAQCALKASGLEPTN